MMVNQMLKLSLRKNVIVNIAVNVLLKKLHSPVNWRINYYRWFSSELTSDSALPWVTNVKKRDDLCYHCLSSSALSFPLKANVRKKCLFLSKHIVPAKCFGTTITGKGI